MDAERWAVAGSAVEKIKERGWRYSLECSFPESNKSGECFVRIYDMEYRLHGSTTRTVGSAWGVDEADALTKAYDVSVLHS